DAAFHPSAGDVVDGAERLREEPGVAIVHAEDERAEPHARGLHRHRGVRGDGLEAVAIAALGRGLLEVVGHRGPVEAGAVGKAPELAQLVHGSAEMSHVNTEGHAHGSRLLSSCRRMFNGRWGAWRRPPPPPPLRYISA